MHQALMGTNGGIRIKPKEREGNLSSGDYLGIQCLLFFRVSARTINGQIFIESDQVILKAVFIAHKVSSKLSIIPDIRAD